MFAWSITGTGLVLRDGREEAPGHSYPDQRAADRQPTEAQSQTQELFASGSLYGQGAMASPELKAAYQKKARPGQSGFNVAFKDYLTTPVVQSIDTEEYTGAIGSTIVISAKDDFRVEQVKVSIRNASGTVLEEGLAVPIPYQRLLYMYTATQVNAALAGTVITATATDLPGNKGRLEVTL